MEWGGTTHRTTIIGKTGSGKTQAGAFILSKSPFHRIPYIIIDYKGDRLFNSVDRIKEISVKDKLPTQPGLYILRPSLFEDDEIMEAWLTRVYRHERTGLFFDEATSVPGNKPGANGRAFQAILHQGRSKEIPALICTQRPAGISRSCFSEADFFALFYLNTEPDVKRVRDMLPAGAADGLTQNFHWRYYDVAADELVRFTPVPDADTIRNRLNDRLAPPSRRRVF